MNPSAISTSETEEAHRVHITSHPGLLTGALQILEQLPYIFFFSWEKAEGTLLGHWSVGVVAPGAVGLQLSTFLIHQCPDLLFGRLC